MGAGASASAGNSEGVSEAEKKKFIKQYKALEDENKLLKAQVQAANHYKAQNMQLKIQVEDSKKQIQELKRKHVEDAQTHQQMTQQMAQMETKTADKDAITTQSALVFDCGTGETKAMRFTYNKDTGVTLLQTGSAPAVLTFLER